MLIVNVLHVLLHILLDCLARPLSVLTIPFLFLKAFQILIVVYALEFSCIVFHLLVLQLLFEITFVLILPKLLLVDKVLFMLFLL